MMLNACQDIIYEFTTYINSAMSHMTSYLYFFDANTEVCSVFAEYHEGVQYLITLCVQRM